MGNTSNEYKPVKFGCGRYIQAPGAISVVGREAAMLKSKKALIVGGKSALEASGTKLDASLRDASIEPVFYTMTSDCTYETLDYLKDDLIPKENCDLVIGTGGGKVTDMAKAAGKCSGLPVINVPTSTATFNCFSAMSVMYTADHKPIDRIWHATENDAVILDEDILVNAPVKLLASGMADSLAKNIETGLMDEAYTIDNTALGMYCSKVLSGTNNAVIFHKGEQAYRDCVEHKVTDAFHDCVYAAVAVTGLAAAVNYGNQSLIRSGTGKGATFAHAMYYACKSIYTQETSNWLHGEIVGLGCQAEMYAFGRNEYEIKNLARFMEAIGQPMSLRDLGIEPTDENIRRLVDSMMVVWGKHPQEHWQIMYDSMQTIKG